MRGSQESKPPTQTISWFHVWHPKKNGWIAGASIRDQTWSPIVGGHQQPFKGSRFHHPKKVTSRFARYTTIHTFRNGDLPLVENCCARKLANHNSTNPRWTTILTYMLQEQSLKFYKFESRTIVISSNPYFLSGSVHGRIKHYLSPKH